MKEIKKSKALTRKQKIALSSQKLNPDDWVLVEQTKFYFKIVNKTSGRIKKVNRYTTPRKENKKIKSLKE